MEYIKMIYNAFILNKNYNYTFNEIQKIRNKKFRKLLKYAYNHSRFYNEYYQDYSINKDDLDDIPIEKLPSIDKNMFIENFDRIVTDKDLNIENINKFIKSNTENSKFLNKYNIIHSSGSTGTPTTFIYDSNAWDFVLAAAFRACKGDISLNDIISLISFKQFITSGFKKINVLYIAATEGRFAGVMAATTGIRGFGFNPMLLNINIPLNKWYEKVIKFNPMVIIGYPSAIKILCDILLQKGTLLNVFRVISCGEPLTNELRNYLQTAFRTDVFDLYGSSESLIIGLKRNNYDGFYIFDDINFVEPMKDCLYITPLYNFKQPLIRYKLTDMAESKERGSNEYLPFTKINSIVGRNEDIMWLTNDNGERDFLHPLVIDDIDINGIIKYQFMQHSYKDIDINLEIKDGFDDYNVIKEFKIKFSKLLKEKNLNTIKYNINVVDKIPIDSHNGKSKLIIRDM